MRNLVLVSIVMALGASVQAIPVAGPVSCSGAAPNESCTVTVSCSASATCNATLNLTINAACTPSGSANPLVLTAAHNNLGPNPGCGWQVTDSADETSIIVLIKDSDGLPVKLLSFSIE